MDEREDMAFCADKMTDVELMQCISEGEHRAMQILVERYQNIVYSTVARMLNNSPETDDIAQQVFINIWKGAKGFNPESSFSTWMFTILKNLVFNELRRQRRKPVVFAEEVDENASGDDVFIDASLSPDSATEYAELETAVNKAIAQLEPDARLAIQLRRFQNMSYEDIAATLGKSVSATKSLLFRARNELKISLSRFLD